MLSGRGRFFLKESGDRAVENLKRTLRALPAAPETVAAFIDAMAARRAPATVRRYVASIAVAHRAVGCSKKLKSPVVRLALQRA